VSLAGEHDDETGFVDINITPLTDVFLVLLAIFLVTGAAFAPGALDVSLPEARSARAASAPRVVTVVVEASGACTVEGRPCARERVEAELRAALLARGAKEVLVASDRGASVERAVSILDAARRAGAERTSLATQGGP
jgi:biopolymer transport protein ExbD